MVGIDFCMCIIYNVNQMKYSYMYYVSMVWNNTCIEILYMHASLEIHVQTSNLALSKSCLLPALNLNC